MKLESLVIADQHAAVNTFPGLVDTARHTMGVGFTRCRCANRTEAADHGKVSDGGDVVTRWPYGYLRLDQLLSKDLAETGPGLIGRTNSDGTEKPTKQN